MSFTPVILDLGINYGTIVSYRFKTSIVTLGDGSEQRTINWSQPLARYQIGQRDVDGPTLDTLLDFFAARQGSYEGFLFKDWADYKFAGGDTKTYTADGNTVTRPILYPDVGNQSFTVPVRFEQDQINFRFKAYRPGDGAKIFTLENLSLVEIRQAPETPLALDAIPDTLGLLDLGYDYETLGGPVFSTSVAGNNAGWEERRANWESAKGRWNIGDRTLNSTELAELIAWFRVCRGAAVPWTFKDWQTETEVTVRFAQDEIAFRFDAYRSSDEESIWQLSGLEVVATEPFIGPPPPPPPPPPSPLEGLRWEFPCSGTYEPNRCYTPDNIVVTTISIADTGEYTLRFRGIVEGQSYTGGSQDGDWYAMPSLIANEDVPLYCVNDSANSYLFSISDPPQSYFINSGFPLEPLTVIDFTKTVTINAGATVSIYGISDPLNNFPTTGTQVSNSGNTVVPGVPPYPLPYDGQFIEVTVLAIA